MDSAVRLVDVARAAGVSKSTASRALTGAPRISEETRSRVERVAAELGYVRDLRAAALSGWHHATIGMMVRGTDTAFYSAIIAAAQDVCDELDLELLIVNGGNGLSHQRRGLQSLVERRVDGIFIASGRAEREALLEISRAQAVTSIGIDMLLPQADTVVIDPSFEVELANQVVAHGHRRVGVSIAPAEHSYTLNLRGERFKQTLESVGVTTTMVRVSPDDNCPLEADLKAAIAAGVTAFMAGDDLQALTIIEYLNSCGYRVPADISVTGFDGVGVFASPLLGITTVRQPIPEMVRAGITSLLRRIQCRDLEPQQLYFPGELLVGRTLGQCS